tara:strand:+ start:2281 stop:2475 length:195 start_codon:yes stop_codon:yes gene_type:complete
MYLNIINNIRHESKRKSKKTDYSLEQEKNDLESEINKVNSDSDSLFYYSVFYGDLTKNWINLKH